ncbi:YbdK family carboxylate-amine ligase [Conexibacter sp. JD483]|uniref:carboxylate-amine ligase n=1 Tax=unclassified Conexibacter TaxID=2627773 RepID=UPI00271E96C8|nr:MULTISPECIES: YbdK family carboxylate-amine ligase [unclassified Conexibacter]MDO8185982.1 YbdK family carboxylate-amine ligase [Conexibacter sp. CPCC 205706]MDO8199473.1 YbdK family carboxylate-amine ligase [Conexibacter sp. CPCC 205762]MDR9368591.1 YbdK family carboxylate-amine ligase [Conexibacter sp. JD483]
MTADLSTPLDAFALRRRFDAAAGLTVGVEEETMLLDPATHDLAPVAGAVLARLGGDARFKPELPASQLEIVTVPVATAAEAVDQLAAARRDLVAAADGLALPAAAGVHPTAAVEGILNCGARYELLQAQYRTIARRQLVAGLQIHVAVGGADRTLAVHDALRSHLPELAALAANAPFHAGIDTGLASIRPTISAQLPRQGVPPPLESWERFASELRWGSAAGGVPQARMWWWELRPHPAFGTLELRVPDAQTTVAEAAGVIALTQALVATLADRFDAGQPLPVAPTWRIEENRWAALRDGLDATFADLATGAPAPARERIAALIDAVAPAAARLGSAAQLEQARALLRDGGAARQRTIAHERGGIVAVPGWLAERFLA